MDNFVNRKHSQCAFARNKKRDIIDRYRILILLFQTMIQLFREYSHQVSIVQAKIFHY